MRFAHFAVLTPALVVFSMAVVGRAAAGPPCAPPPGFRDAPHPAIAPPEQLVSHTEEILIDRPLSVVSAAMSKPLNQAIRRSKSLPGVSGDFMLTMGAFGGPGSRHIVCLTDGGSTEEEALEQEDSPTSSHFRYIVWNYSTPKAKPIAYGVGEFRTVQLDGGHTRITWTYSFKLKEDTFPGELGALGSWLFKAGFLDRDYAAMMQSVLRGYRVTAEEQPAVSTALSSHR
jgi:Polyketide cyclase / dehydrase and lipid transport